MALITWNDSLELKIGTLDAQHKKWVGMLNQLNDAMAQGKGQETLKTLLNDVINYTAVHFSTEEKLMQQAGYADLPGHKQLHEQMSQKVADIKARFDKGQIMVSVQVMGMLKDWLTNHILTHDKKYAPFLIAKGVR